MLGNTWNIVVDWFKDRSERSRVMRSFNQASNESFISGIAPTLLRSSMSRGESAYKHQFSAWMNTGFRIQALSGRSLSKEEMMFIGTVLLSDTTLIRTLVTLGWDTLEVHDDIGVYGCRWKLIDYAKLGLMIE